MRRTVIVEATEQILNAIQESNIVPALQSVRDAIRRSDSPKSVSITPVMLKAVLDTNQKYVLLSQSFTPAARKISEILNISDLEATDFWVEVLANVSDVSSYRRVVRKIDDIRFVTEYLPSILKLLEPEESLDIEDGSVLSITLPEDTNQVSRPTRIIDVLQGIQNLYEVCAFINNLPSDGLSVLNLDSGSDKSFDLLGAAEVMECVRAIINDLWDRVVFYRERKALAGIDLITRSLPAIEEIGRLEQENRITPEQAELLKRKLIDGSSKFLNSGAITPEIEQRSTFNPRVLMKPEPKLLTTTTLTLPRDEKISQHNDTLETEIDESGTTDLDYTISDEYGIDISSLSQSQIEAIKKMISESQSKTNETETEKGDAKSFLDDE